MAQLYVIEYESAHWCGGQSYCVVWAETEQDAEDIASLFMDESMRELFDDAHEDQPELDEDLAFTVNSVQLMAGSEFEEYYNMPDQRAAFYPCVN